MGGSKSYTAGYKYYMGQHLTLTNGPIDSINRITLADRTAWSGNSEGESIVVEAPTLFGGDEGGISGTIDVLMGYPDQQQNSYLQSVLGAVIPAFRGVTSLVLKRCYLGNSAYLKNIAVRASRVHVRDEGIDQWYDEKAALVYDDAVYMTLTGDFDQGPGPFGKIYAAAGDEDFLDNIDFPYPQSAWEPETSIVLTKTIVLTKLPDAPILIKGAIENRLVILVNGVQVLDTNPYNSDITGFPRYQVAVQPQQFVIGTNVITFKGYDELTPIGGTPPTYDRTYLAAEIFQEKFVDMNPAHIIRELDTSTIYGIGRPDYEMNDESFMAAADVLFDEGMGMSLLWDSASMTTDDLVKEVARHIDAAHYVNRDGLFTLKLIRNDYDVESLIVLDDSNILRVESAMSTPTTELVNAVSVVYWDRKTGKNASVQVSDPALVQMQGRIKSTTLQYPGFTNAEIATRVAMRDLRALSNSMFSFKIVVNRVPDELNIGDPFILNVPSVKAHNMVVRVADIDWGDGQNNEISISCSQDMFALPEQPVMSSSPDTAWEDPRKPPLPSPFLKAFELPYYLLVSQEGQGVVDALLTTDPEVGRLGVIASKPSSNAIDAELAVDAGAGYEIIAERMNFCGTAMLVSELNEMTDSLTFEQGVNMSDVAPNYIAQIDDEYVRVVSVDLNTSTVDIERGLLDTVPKKHFAGAVIYFIGDDVGSDFDNYVDGETVNAKVMTATSGGQLDLSIAPEVSVTMDSRAIRPYAPGMFQLNGEYYPPVLTGTIVVSWATRNRLQQTGLIPLNFLDSAVTPEPGATETVRLLNSVGTLLEEHNDLVDGMTSVTPTGEGEYRMQLLTERDGYTSFQVHDHLFEYTSSLSRFAIPLTFDERSGDGTVYLTRLGAAPWITPDGFVGDGYTARYRMELADMPVWVTRPNGFVTLHASVRAVRGSRHATRDVVVSLCDDNATANPKLEICIMKDNDESTLTNVAVRCYTSAMQTKRVLRGNWSYGFRYPQLLDGVNKIRPQAILFLDSTTLLIVGHYDDTKSRAFRMDLSTMTVTGQFDFTGGRNHVASAAYRASDGTYWFGDYSTGDLIQVDLAASFTAGTSVVTLTYNMSTVIGFGAIEWINVSGTDYLLAAEYSTSGTRYLYVVLGSTVVNAGTFAIASRFKRFITGARRMQGVCFEAGKLYLSMNQMTADPSPVGRIQRFDILTAIASTADGGTLTPEFSWYSPSVYVEDIDFHPVTGEIWTSTEGLSASISDDGWLSCWHTQLSTLPDGYTPENHITVEYGAGFATIKINNQLFEVMSWSPTVSPAVISIGGPPTAAAGQTNGFFVGTVRNIVIQNQVMDSTQYDDAISGIDEPNTLTAYNVTITNPGGESTVTGWTNETGSLANRALNPLPRSGASYFSGGTNASTIARQRFNLATVTGLSTTDIDAAAVAGKLWARCDWWQSSFIGDTDTGSMGIRMLNGTPTQLSLTYSGMINITPQQTQWIPRGLTVPVPNTGRNIDLVYSATRFNGTNNDLYVDDITLTIYLNPELVTVDYSVYGAMPIPLGYDGTRFVFSVAVNSEGSNYRATAWALPGDTALTRENGSRLPAAHASYVNEFSAVTNGSYVTLCSGSSFSRVLMSELYHADLADWSTNTYSTYPVADVTGSVSFVNLASGGGNVFTFDISNGYGVVLKSTDGLAFSEPSTTDGTGLRASVCKYADGLYVAGGLIYKRATTQVELVTSPDLVTFTPRAYGLDIPVSTPTNTVVGSTIDILEFGGNILAIVLMYTGADQGYNILQSTDNGATWTKKNPTGWVNTDIWQSLALYGSDLLVLGKGKTARTTDLTTWTVTALSDVDVLMDKPIVGGTTIVCRGRKTVPSPLDPLMSYSRFTAWKSTDGTTFTQLTE
jgi:hypothetical protein